MRVLITNNTLAQRAGTELYVRDIAFALRRRGHEPVAYSSHLGEVAEELRAGGITTLDDLSRMQEPPDVIHAHHHLDAIAAMLRFPRVPAILFCHGSTPWEESPFDFPSIRNFVAIDDACHERLIAAGVPPAAITTLRTFVDLQRFPLREACQARPRRALVFSNNATPGGALDLIRGACAEAGIHEVDAIGDRMGSAVARPEEILHRYDLVFAKARAAHEAAATGAAVIVSDYSRFAGLLTTETYAAWRPLNFGIRTLVHPLKHAELVAEIQRYQAKDVRLVAEQLRREADLETTMDRLIELYERTRSDRDHLAALPERLFTDAASVYLRALAVRLKSHDRLASLTRHEEALRAPDVASAQPGDQLHVLEDKIRRLTSSYSWRFTAPLRFLRRSFIDPFLSRSKPIDCPRFDPENNHDYQHWIKTRQTAAQAHKLPTLSPGDGPLISIVMPVFNTPEPWLSRAIESVRKQTYTQWELCIANDASTDERIGPLLAGFAALDARIKVTRRERNGHISAASNSALELATGEFIALLDHDDEFNPRALAEIAFAISRQPDLDFIYTDEDKIDTKGSRFSPYFKPDWNPDLLLGQNYTCHLSVFRTARLREIGGWRVGYEGSQDWDLTLRFTADLDPSRILHIPEILYHWRAIPGSTALSLSEKRDYPAEAAHRALTDRLKTDGIKAELIAVKGGHWRVKRELPAPAPKVSIIIPTRNAVDLLRRCVDSLLDGTDYPNFEIIIVNHCSDDPATLAYFDQVSDRGVRVVPCNLPVFNFSSINNGAVQHATGSILAFLNNDLELINGDWLHEMVAQAVRPEIGAVGAMLYYPDDRVQHAGVVLGLGERNGNPGVAGHAFKGYTRGASGQRNRLRLVQNYSAVTAACLVIRRNVFEQVGGFDEANLAVAFNDVDLCLRLRAAGYRNLWTPFAEFYHHESATRGKENTPEKQRRFSREVDYMREKWGPLLDSDPAYNPSLTLTREDFSLARSHRQVPYLYSIMAQTSPLSA